MTDDDQFLTGRQITWFENKMNEVIGGLRLSDDETLKQVAEDITFGYLAIAENFGSPVIRRAAFQTVLTAGQMQSKNEGKEMYQQLSELILDLFDKALHQPSG